MSSRVEDPVYLKVKNSDGTNNISVTVEVMPSDEPYKCIASEIPGWPGHEETSAIYIRVRKHRSTEGPTTTSTVTVKGQAVSLSDGHLIGQYRISFKKESRRK